MISMASNGHFCNRDYSRNERHEFHDIDMSCNYLYALAAHLNTDTTTNAQLLRNESEFGRRSHFNAKLPCKPKQYYHHNHSPRHARKLVNTRKHIRKRTILACSLKMDVLVFGHMDLHILQYETPTHLASCTRIHLILTTAEKKTMPAHASCSDSPDLATNNDESASARSRTEFATTNERIPPRER